jgi:hypothetical protein
MKTKKAKKSGKPVVRRTSKQTSARRKPKVTQTVTSQPATDSSWLTWLGLGWFAGSSSHSEPGAAYHQDDSVSSSNDDIGSSYGDDSDSSDYSSDDSSSDSSFDNDSSFDSGSDFDSGGGFDRL